MMVKGTYIGPDPYLKGETALVQKGDAPGEIKVQFDDIVGLPKELTHGWTKYPEEFWEIEDRDEDGTDLITDLIPDPEQPLNFD